MNRQNRALLVVGIAILFASLASFGVYRAIRQIPVREVPVATTFAVVARDRLEAGTLLAAQQLQVVPWPEANPLKGGFMKVDDIVGRGLVSSVVPNEPITESKLAPKGSGGGLPPMIPNGMRAIAVKVNDVIAVAGFTVPGTRVDVVVTVRGGSSQESMSRVVVSNVQVLAAGTKFDQDKSKDGQAMPTTVVTLLVTPSDAERIALAQTDGQVMLVLRNPMDVDPAQTNGVRMSGLVSAPNAAPVKQVIQGRTRMVPAAPPPPPPAPYTVEAIRGAKRSEEVVH
jgi:pilus assembly protein CpaB